MPWWQILVFAVLSWSIVTVFVLMAVYRWGEHR